MVVNDTNHRGGKCPNYLFLHHIGDFWERTCHLQQLSSPKRLTARYQDSYVCVCMSHSPLNAASLSVSYEKCSKIC